MTPKTILTERPADMPIEHYRELRAMQKKALKAHMRGKVVYPARVEKEVSGTAKDGKEVTKKVWLKTKPYKRTNHAVQERKAA